MNRITQNCSPANNRLADFCRHRQAWVVLGLLIACLSCAQVFAHNVTQYYIPAGLSSPLDQQPRETIELALRQSSEGKERGDVMYFIGVLYEQGNGVKKDYKRAMQWYREAAQLGSLPAQTSIARLYQEGKGVRKNTRQALLWLRKAAKKGDAKAMGGLGRSYMKGLGVKRNYRKALHWYIKAADNGDVEACVKVGRFYETGRGVRADYNKAMKWYQKAESSGYQDARQHIESLNRKMRKP